MKKTFYVFGLALIAALGMTVSAWAGNLVSVGYAQAGHDSSWLEANAKNYKDVFSEQNGYTLLLAECGDNQDAQFDAIRSFINQQVDYIVVAPLTPSGWDDILAEAKGAGIPVFITDREVEASDETYTAWIGTNTYNEGISAAEWLAEYLNGADAKILQIEGSENSTATMDRADALSEIMEEHENWTLVDSKSGDFSQEGAKEVMESFIESYKDQFNVLICHSDNETFGAMEAMDAAGISYGMGTDIIMISYDATRQGLQYTLEGKINCNVECNPLIAGNVDELIKKMQSGEEYDSKVLINDDVFVAPGIESGNAATVSQEMVDSRAY